MKVAILAEKFSSGGANVYISQLSEKLSENGISSYIITTNYRDKNNNINSKIKICNLYNFKGNSNPFGITEILFKVFLTMYSVYSIRKIIKKYNIDIIHTLDFISSPSFSVAAGILSTFFKIPIIYDVRAHGLSWKYLGYNYKYNIIKYINKLVLRIFNYTIFISVDNFFVSEAKKLGINDQKITVIPTPIEIEKIINKNYHSELVKKELNIPINSQVLLFIGTLSYNKGIQYLIKSFYNMLSNGYGNVYLVIIGDGKEKENILNLTKKLGCYQKTRFLGYVQHDQIFKYISASDIFILPSLSEGVPGAIVEAMAMGKPVVGTEVGGVPEVILNGVNGLLVKPKNILELEKAIKKLINDSNLREFMGKNGKKMAIQNHTWDSAIVKIVNLYYEIT